MFGRKGQSSVEIIMVMAAVMIVLAFIYMASQQQLTQSQDRVRVGQARLTVSTLASAARDVYSEGPGSVRTVTVTIPEGNINTRTGIFNETIINIGLYVANGVSDINEIVPFRLVQGANFPLQPGTYNLNIRAFPGYVMAGDPSYTVLPGTVGQQMLSNDTKTQVLTVTSYANSPLNITLNLTWSNAGITANMNGSSSLNFMLAPNATARVNVNFVSTNAALATYSGTVKAYSSDLNNQTVFLITQIVGSQPPVPTGVSYILIDTYADSGYTTPASSFDTTETVDIHGAHFTANSTITVNVRNATGALIHTGSNTSDGSGAVVYYWNPGSVPSGTYNVTLNDSTKVNSTTFSITGCT